MLKRIYSLLIIIVIFAINSLPVFATSYQDYDYSIFTSQAKAYSIGDYISKDTIEKFNKYSEDIESRFGINMVFIITNDLDGSVEEFSDYIFLNAPLGKEYNDNIIMLVVDMTGRRVDLYTHGTGMKAITDDNTNYILDEIAVPALKSEDYNGLVDEFAKTSEKFIQDWVDAGSTNGEENKLVDVDSTTGKESGTADIGSTTGKESGSANVGSTTREKNSSVDAGYKTRGRSTENPNFVLTGILIGAVFTAILIIIKVMKHRPVRVALDADQYATAGSFQLTEKSDRFIRTHTTKIAIPKDKDKNKNNGRKVTSHSHSSGNSHGGGSRSF